MNKSDEDKKKSDVIQLAVVLCILTFLGFYLRVRHLGAFGFWGDEDLTSLAVKAIMKHGYPLFPSGMIYPRSIGLHYIMAVSASWFGPTEFALRLPAALFGTAMIPLAFMMSNRLYGKVIGLMAAAMICLSFSEIEIARYARMYAPFSFFYVLTVYSFYHYYVNGNSGPRWIVFILALLTLTLHSLAFSLAFMYLIPFFFRKYKIVSKRHLILNFLAFSGAFFIVSRLQGVLYSRPKMLHSINTAGSDMTARTGKGLVDHVFYGMKHIVNRFQIPSLDAFNHLIHTHPMLSLGLFVTMAALIVIILWWSRQYLSMGKQVLLGLILTSCVLQLFNLSFLLLIIFVYLYREGLLAFRKVPVLAIIAFITISFITWFLYAYFALEPSKLAIAGGSSHIRQALKTILDYPTFRLVWAYVLQRPLLSIFAAFGFLACFHAAAREQSDQNALFLMLIVAGPLLLNGVMKTHYQLFRYSIHLDVFYLTLVALGAFAVPIVLKQICLGRDTHLTLTDQGLLRLKKIHWAAILPVLCLIVLLDLKPVNAWLTTGKRYNSEQRWNSYFDAVSYPDLKTTAKYVRDRMRSDDLIIAVQTTREYFNYLGRLDYWVGSGYYDGQTYRDGNTIRDLYVAVPQIRDVEHLKTVLEGNIGKQKWLLASASSLRLPYDPNINPKIVDYILTLQDKIVYVGKDQNHRVYLIE